MIISAIYSRVSSIEQVERENSIPAQIRAMREYCVKNDIKIFDEYIDEGISGQKEDRPSFQRMLKDARAKKFNIILVHKFDRFARKIELSRKIKTQLKEAGIIVVSITEPIEDSPMGFFLEGLHELMSEYYIKNLAMEVKKGMGERVLKGVHMGQMPYGYYVEDGKVLINQSQAEIVKKIFELYLNEGMGHMKIAKYLNEHKIPSYAGIVGAWQSFQVSQILKNYKYIGKNKWSGKIYDAVHEPIIDEIMFMSVQKQVGVKAEKFTCRGNNYDKFRLLGLLYCGVCGKNFRIHKINSGRKSEYWAYQCYDAVMYRGGCTFTSLFRSDKIEQELDDYIQKVMTESIKGLTIINEKPIDARDIINDRLSKLNKELSRAKTAYLGEVFTLDEYRQTKAKIEAEIKHLENEKVKDCNTDTGADRKRLVSLIKDAWDLYNETESPMVKKNILQKFIRKIEVFPDKTIKVVFYI